MLLLLLLLLLLRSIEVGIRDSLEAAAIVGIIVTRCFFFFFNPDICLETLLGKKLLISTLGSNMILGSSLVTTRTMS